MVVRPENVAPEVHQPEHQRPGHQRQASDALVSDGFLVPDLEAPDEAPPAYGDVLDELHLSQSGFEAGAAITNDGRVNINIREKNRRLADLLAPTLRNQLVEEGATSHEALPPAYIPPSLGGQPGQIPPPKMNVVVQIVGSRGDVQPFVALGKVLHETYGHRVRIATHATFQKFVEENGLEFFNIGGDPAELMAFMVKNPGLMPGLDALKTGEVQKRRKGMEQILVGCWRSCIEAGNGLGPSPRPHSRRNIGTGELPSYGNDWDKPFVADAIIANPPSFAHVHVAEKLGIPLHMMFTMPWTPTRAFPHPLANIQSTETDVTMTNYTSYALVEMMTWQGLGDVINRFRAKALDLEPISLVWAPGLLTRLRVPYTYCWSPALIPKPNDWGSNIDISGFYFLNLASNYTPEPDLAEFLAAGPPPVYIGFGSIVVDDPNGLTRLILDAISMSGVRALVSKGWGGLGTDAVGLPEGVFMLGNCPHDWLFKHVSAVVHHGGAGTTAAGINAGKPTVVVPFFGDQPFWGAMIHRAGAGPAPIPNKTLTAENLAEALKECMKPETQAKARELGEKIRQEQGCDVGGMKFHDHLDVEGLRCSLAPSRVAVWRVRRTKVRLSAFAAAVLLREGILQNTDLKLYRSKEYDTEEQPWDPISAVTASLLADMASIGMGIAEMPWDVYKAASASSKKHKDSSASETKSQPGTCTTTNDDASVTTATPSLLTNTTSMAEASTQSILSSKSEAVLSPSVTVTSPDTMSISGNTEFLTETENTSISDLPHSPSGSPVLGRTASSSQTAISAAHEAGPPNATGDSESSKPPEGSRFDMEDMVQTGRGVGRIVETGLKSPLNFCMGLAKGFRNVPRLYNDDTIRPQEKVTDMSSGLKVAGKEFGLGMYDGIAGLVTQPLRGAKKDGAKGLVTGFAKGIGGVMVKPAAAIWALPAYTMAGIHAEYRSISAKSMENYIVASRIRQGDDDYLASNPNERHDIISRWQTMSSRQDLQPFYLFKGREMALKKKEEKHLEKQEQRRASDSSSNAGLGLARLRKEKERSSSSSWLAKGKNSLAVTFDQQKAQWLAKRGFSPNTLGNGRFGGSQWSLTPSTSTTSTTASSGVAGARPASSGRVSLTEDEEFERAIQASVQQTSRGDSEEDAMIEQAIRASVNEMRRREQEQREWEEMGHAVGVGRRYSEQEGSHENRHHELGWEGGQVEGVIAPEGEIVSSSAATPANRNRNPPYHGQSVHGRQPYVAELEGSSLPTLPPRTNSMDKTMLAGSGDDTLTAESMQISDEEYQRLIEQAIQRSVLEQQHHNAFSSGIRRHEDSDEDEELRRIMEESAAEEMQREKGKGKQIEVPDEEDEELQRVLAESREQDGAGPSGARAEEEEQQLKKAIEESKAEAEKQEAQGWEENVVLEYVKKQSIAEEAYRQRIAKGKMPEGYTGEGVEGGDEDEELRRAMEESLKISRPSGGEPSH